jgi:hypothetical protein
MRRRSEKPKEKLEEGGVLLDSCAFSRSTFLPNSPSPMEFVAHTAPDGVLLEDDTNLSLLLFSFLPFPCFYLPEVL